MMKNIYLFLLLMACGTSAFAQSFTVSPSPVATMAIPEGTNGEATIYFQNMTSGSISLVWSLSANTLGSNWSVSICDNNLCYFSAYPGDTMLPVNGGQNGFLKFTCDIAQGQAGSGQLKYNVHVSGDESSMVEVTFDVNPTSTSISVSDFSEGISVSPNPASSHLSLRAATGKLEKGNAQIFDMSGKLLREVTVKGVEAQDIDVQDLPTGSYMLRYLSSNSVVSRRFIKTN